MWDTAVLGLGELGPGTPLLLGNAILGGALTALLFIGIILGGRVLWLTMEGVLSNRELEVTLDFGVRGSGGALCGCGLAVVYFPHCRLQIYC